MQPLHEEMPTTPLPPAGPRYHTGKPEHLGKPERLMDAWAGAADQRSAQQVMQKSVRRVQERSVQHHWFRLVVADLLDTTIRRDLQDARRKLDAMLARHR